MVGCLMWLATIRRAHLQAGNQCNSLSTHPPGLGHRDLVLPSRWFSNKKPRLLFLHPLKPLPKHPILHNPAKEGRPVSLSYPVVVVWRQIIMVAPR